MDKTEQGTERYPIAEAIPPAELAAEIKELERLDKLPWLARLPGYLRLGGPGFMDAALTLGGGTLAAAMLSGARNLVCGIWVSCSRSRCSTE